jgi:AraC-like DNA-binding protein
MGYSLHRIEGFGAPFQVVHEQVVTVPAHGYMPVFNSARKLLYVLGGECRHRVMDWEGHWADVHLRPGDILCLPHRCEQRYISLEPGSVGRLHVVRLSYDPDLLPPLPLMGEERAAAGLSTPQNITTLANQALQTIRYLRAGQDGPVRETLEQLCEEARRRPPEYALRIHGLCVSLTVLFARQVVEWQEEKSGLPETRATTEYHVEKIKDYLRHHLYQPLQLAQVAEHVRLSEEHTARLFKKRTGMTVLEYGRRLRIAEAKNLLATTERNTSEIARATGFASLTVFSRNFKREVGVTPSEFRQQIAQQMG